MKKIILLLVMILSLAGCVPAAFVAGAAATTVVVSDKRNIKTMISDRNAARMAQEKINRNQAFKGKSHISVAVFNQVALLVGQAQDPELRIKADQIASQTKGVHRVYNEILLGGSTSDLQRVNDSWLTTKVKTAMLAQKGLNSSQIKVVTENSVIYLMGLVTPQQGDLAADVARRIAGVTKVVKVFQYDNISPA